MVKVSVILPCLNEEDSLGKCITQIQQVLFQNKIDGEIIVADNGSMDNSAKIAKQFSVKYVFEPNKGYGNAYLAGLKRAEGELLILGDPDSSYDFKEIPNFLRALENSDFVLGSRFQGKIKKGSMPFLHRYVGNPGIRLLLFVLFNIKVSEPSTGFIALKRTALKKLKLKQQGMEFSSEIIVMAKKRKLRMKEIPIDYHVRSGTSKLRTFRDGYRHAKFLISEKIQPQ